MGTFAACYCTYDDTEWLAQSLESIYPVVDAIYILISDRPWNGPMTKSAKTIELVASFPDPDRKMKLVLGEWRSEVEQRNAGLQLLTRDGHEYCFIIDADEIYDTASLDQMKEFIRQNPQVDCWHCWFIVYWKSPKFRIDPPERHHPPVFLRLGTGTFIEYRNCVAGSHELIPPQIGFCHHMSYARNDEEILRKIQSFSHSHQIDPNWFQKKWKAWDNDHGITDLCPYNPGVFERTAEVPEHALPQILREQKNERWIPS